MKTLINWIIKKYYKAEIQVWYNTLDESDDILIKIPEQRKVTMSEYDLRTIKFYLESIRRIANK